MPLICLTDHSDLCSNLIVPCGLIVDHWAVSLRSGHLTSADEIRTARTHTDALNGVGSGRTANANTRTSPEERKCKQLKLVIKLTKGMQVNRGYRLYSVDLRKQTRPRIGNSKPGKRKAACEKFVHKLLPAHTYLMSHKTGRADQRRESASRIRIERRTTSGFP